MEREEIARERRRQQVREQLEFERERETALQDQLVEVIAEQLGSQVDEAAFAQMDPEDVAVVREALGGPADDPEEDPVEEYEAGWTDDGEDDEADPEADAEAEIARLEAELAACRRRQQAHERYLEALGGGSSEPAAAT